MSEDNKFKKPEQYKESPNLESATPMEDKTNSALEAEVAAIDLEMKRLMLVKTRSDVAKIKSDMQAQFEIAESKRIATLQFLASRKANQDRCNHRKGGRGPDAVMRGQGDDASYALIKHRLPHREFMVLCQRCGKEWHPANKWNVENGVLKPLAATSGPGQFDNWSWAIQANSDNTPSASSDFSFSKVEA
jgi:hypothetical protein